MIIEGYVFIPYQGQLRFRFDSDAAKTALLKSDAQYDKRLGVHDLIEGYGDVRPCTCREFIYSGCRHYEKEIREALESELVQALTAEPTLSRKVTIGTVKHFGKDLPVELTVLRISK